MAIVVTVALSGTMAWAEEERLRVRPDPFYSGQELVDTAGARVGRVRPDPSIPISSRLTEPMDRGSACARIGSYLAMIWRLTRRIK